MDESSLNDFDTIFDGGGDIPTYVTPKVELSVKAPIKEVVKVVSHSLQTESKDDIIVPDSKPVALSHDVAKDCKSTPRHTIHDLTDDERPREKALKQGMESLSDVELLALLLGSGIPGKSVLDLSREILKDNDNRLAYLSRKSIPELVRKYKGMGVAKATLLVAAMTFGARTQADLQLKDPQMSSSEVVYSYMRSRLERLNNEEFWILHLSRANRLQSVEQISKGGQSQTSVDVKFIAKSVIDRLSAGVILCHNHPSGNLKPSGPDDTLTRRIIEVCKLIEVPVLDHLIIGPSGYYSYRDEGRL